MNVALNACCLSDDTRWFCECVCCVGVNVWCAVWRSCCCVVVVVVALSECFVIDDRLWCCESMCCVRVLMFHC